MMIAPLEHRCRLAQRGSDARKQYDFRGRQMGRHVPPSVVGGGFKLEDQWSAVNARLDAVSSFKEKGLLLGKRAILPG